MQIHETIFKAKEFMASGDYASARELLQPVLGNHMAVRLLAEIDAAEAQKHLKESQAKRTAQMALQTTAAKDLSDVPAMASMMIVANTFFWAVAISLWFSPSSYALHTFASLILAFSLLIGFYYLVVRKNLWMLAFGWTLLSIGLIVGGFVGLTR